MDIVSSGIPQGKHYVYTLAYPESMGGRVFYVGKGQGKRIHVHERDARLDKGPNTHKNNVIKKIWREGKQIVKTILVYFDTSEEACLYEIALIFFMDGLVNLASGGEGAAGVPHSEETRRKISENTKRQMQSEEARQRLREINTGKRHSEETKRKLSVAGKGRVPPNKGRPGPTPSEETRKKLSDSHKNSPLFQEAIRKVHESQKGRKRPLDTGRKISEAKKGHVVSDETRQKISEAKKGRKQSLESVKRRAETNTGKKRSEETVRKMRAAWERRRTRTSQTSLPATLRQGQLFP